MTISGDTLGTDFNVKVKGILVDRQMNMVDTSGVGDSGESSYVPGRAVTRFSFTGFVEDSNPLQMENILHTTSGVLTINFDGATAAQVISGNVLMSDLDVSGGYTDGLYRVTGQGVFTGALTTATL